MLQQNHNNLKRVDQNAPLERFLATSKTGFLILNGELDFKFHNDVLLQMFDGIKQKGNTMVCMEQNESVFAWSDWHIERGRKSCAAGGRIVHQEKPKPIQVITPKGAKKEVPEIAIQQEIVLNGISTHGLKNIDVRIPKNKLTVVTGLSGSGKSSLV